VTTISLNKHIKNKKIKLKIMKNSKKIIAVILIIAGVLDLALYYLGGDTGWLELVFNDTNVITMYGAWIMIGTGVTILKKK
jgi:hypothetical protein